MKRRFAKKLIALAGADFITNQQEQGTAFTSQSQRRDNNGLAAGIYNARFAML